MERKGKEAPLLELEHDVVTRSIVACRTSTAIIGDPFLPTGIVELHRVSLFFFQVKTAKRRDAVEVGRPALNPVPHKLSSARPAILRAMNP